ncbi:MAG: SDR family oxidoreductase [Candidatus Omnitrophica bacterium]|nr:SDR family oxidoreductase [Candidatus Omnitrophota bacterium]
MKEHKPTVFLTGGTGLVGSYLLKILLEHGHRVFVLARSKQEKSAEERVIEVLNFWDAAVCLRYKKNLFVLEGDITDENLGFDAKRTKLLTDEVEEIFHTAAITDFSWPLDRIRKVNVDGTSRLFNFACELKKLRKINHISTIYICGDYKGYFKETNLDVGQKFNSSYEQSKFEAEKLVEEFRKKGLWIDVFRPPIIIGETQTGKVLTFDRALYQAVRLWNLEMFDFYPTKENFYLYVVCVDELSKGIYCISSKTSKSNINYHPFSDQPLSPQEIMNYTCEFVGSKKPRLIPFVDYLKTKATPTQMKLLKSNLLFLDRNAILDSKETRQFLSKNGIEFSKFDRNLFERLLNYCLRRGFLRRK